MTILEYIDKYQHQTFHEVPFNEVDNVIMASISYIDFDGIVCNHSYKKITIEEASDIYFQKYAEKKNSMTSYKQALQVLKMIKKTKRYGGLLLYNYSYVGDEKQQFSAVTIEIHPDLIYVSYEGTDHLVSGWKEDFEMSYRFPVSSQRRAIRYLDRFTVSNKNIILGGHSKGGNLALVAGMFSNAIVRSKIIKIYSNDGPGLRKMQFDTLRYQEISKKLVSIIPNYSLVGLLLRHSHNYKVVLSDKKGILAHAFLSWQVEDQEFKSTELSTFSKILDKSMFEWLNKYNDEQRRKFTNAIFDVFYRANIHNLVDVMDHKKLILKLILESRGIDKTTKKMMRDFIWVIFEYVKDYKEL